MRRDPGWTTLDNKWTERRRYAVHVVCIAVGTPDYTIPYAWDAGCSTVPHEYVSVLSGHTAKVYYEFMPGPGADDGMLYLDPHALLSDDVVSVLLFMYTVPSVLNCEVAWGPYVVVSVAGG